jgi:hypothetical protein
MRTLRTKSRKNEKKEKILRKKNESNKKINSSVNNSLIKKKSTVTNTINNIPKKKKEKVKEEFADNDLVDFLKVSVDDNETDGYVPLHEREYESKTDRYLVYTQKYITIFLKYGLMTALMTMNFIALSISLNCNVNEEFFKRIFSAIFAFFFGFVYIIVNYYTYRVLVKKQICKMNREKLFPFSA